MNRIYMQFGLKADLFLIIYHPFIEKQRHSLVHMVLIVI